MPTLYICLHVYYDAGTKYLKQSVYLRCTDVQLDEPTYSHML
jgi:hypothetical protein